MERLAVLYDGDCGFCRASMALILAWDRRRRLRPVALQDAEADRLLQGMPDEERMASWHLVGADGRVASGGAALVPMLRELRGGGPLAWVTARFQGPTERAYRWTADNRSWLGQMVPGGLKRRADRVILSRR